MPDIHIDVSNDAYIARIAICEAAAQWERPSVLFRPTVSLDGNMYCALYGEDLMNGVAGFGDTMEAAMRDFDKNWGQQKAPTPRKKQFPQCGYRTQCEDC